ncbi:chloride channel [Dipodascopsis uninucleata]
MVQEETSIPLEDLSLGSLPSFSRQNSRTVSFSVPDNLENDSASPYDEDDSETQNPWQYRSAENDINESELSSSDKTISRYTVVDFAERNDDLNKKGSASLHSMNTDRGDSTGAVLIAPSTNGRFSIDSVVTVQENNPIWDMGNGTGRRVAYEDLSAIDWIHEYNKDRLRKASITMGHGISGKLFSLWDSSQVWVILIATGMSVGILASSIDIVSNWLGDLKQGYCRESGFYLSKEFCCWGTGIDETCDGWVDWSTALHASGALGTFVEYVFYILFAVLFGVAASFFVLQYSEYASNSGIPEIKTILGGFVMRGFLGSWTLVTKALGLCLASGSGLWLGKEGPLVHVACCCANIACRMSNGFRHNEARKREIFSAAAAAGIAVAFGAPIGGVLFSLEQVSYYYPDKTMWQSFVCAMVASVVIQLMNPFRTGKLVLFQVTDSRPFYKFELIPFLFLGLLGGIFGHLLIKANIRIARWRFRSWLADYPLTEVASISLITAIIDFPDMFSRMQNNVLVFHLFQECDSANALPSLCESSGYGRTILLLLYVCIVGLVMTSITFGTSVPSGVLMPSMVIGAAYGRIFGVAMQAWHERNPDFFMFRQCLPDVPCLTPGVYAIVGAASSLAGVTRLTVSIVVIVFELTGALAYVLPIMIAVMVSKWVGDAFDKKGIYEAWIALRDYPYLDNKQEVVSDATVSDIMTRADSLIVLPASGHNVDSLTMMLETQDFKGYPIVTDLKEMMVVGYISRSDLRYSLDEARKSTGLLGTTMCYFGGVPPPVDSSTILDLREWADHTPLTLSYRSSISLVVSMFEKLGLRYLMLTKSGRLEGLLTKKDICAKYMTPSSL